MPAEPSIVPLDPSGAEDAARLFHDAWHETQAHLQDARIARFRDLGFFRERVVTRMETSRVAVVAGQCVGYVSWTEDRLNSLFVGRPFRGMGIGEALCAEAVRRMTLGGHSRFCLDCLQGNDDARRFYELLGWRVDSLRMMQNDFGGETCEVSAWMMVKP